jgi:hypothetical protein
MLTLSIEERVGRRPKVEIHDSCCPPQHIVARPPPRPTNPGSFLMPGHSPGCPFDGGVQ